MIFLDSLVPRDESKVLSFTFSQPGVYFFIAAGAHMTHCRPSISASVRSLLSITLAGTQG